MKNIYHGVRKIYNNFYGNNDNLAPNIIDAKHALPALENVNKLHIYAMQISNIILQRWPQVHYELYLDLIGI